MELTEEQQRRIAHYLREVNRELESLSVEGRREAFARAKGRVIAALRRLPPGEIPDADVNNILRSCGPPADLAGAVREDRPQIPARFLDVRDRTWLGVCGGIARLTGLRRQNVRRMAVLLGVVTGPVALVLYLACYFAMYLAEDPECVLPINRRHLIRTLASSFGVTLAVFACTEAMVWVITYVYARLSGQAQLVLEPWGGWLDVHGPSLFLMVLALVLPIGALSALPVPFAWGSTLRKTTQAILALYALVLSLGVLCLLAGVVLQAIEQATGMDLLETLFSAF